VDSNHLQPRNNSAPRIIYNGVENVVDNISIPSENNPTYSNTDTNTDFENNTKNYPNNQCQDLVSRKEGDNNSTNSTNDNMVLNGDNMKK